MILLRPRRNSKTVRARRWERGQKHVPMDSARRCVPLGMLGSCEQKTSQLWGKGGRKWDAALPVGCFGCCGEELGHVEPVHPQDIVELICWDREPTPACGFV